MLIATISFAACAVVTLKLRRVLDLREQKHRSRRMADIH